MSGELAVLVLTAVTIGFFHTVFGPDHYMPFIMMARVRGWSRLKTGLITLLCGVGHVGSSIVLGFLGVALGIAVEKLEIFESARGNWAAWGLIAFGLLYTIYGIHQAVKNKPHTHPHVHEDGSIHVHEHVHQNRHAHLHTQAAKSSYVPWALFVIFVLGPCEPLIPLLMYPAAKHSVAGVAAVASVFSITTIATMMVIVFSGVYGLSFVRVKSLERYSHALAGFMIFLCGCGIQFLGL